MLDAVFFESEERSNAFVAALESRGVRVRRAALHPSSLQRIDFTSIDIVIHYPTFEFTSNHPLALVSTRDLLGFIAARHPHLAMYPDPGLLPYYNDKYRQWLFLRANEIPIPATIPLIDGADVDQAARSLGFPMVVKNRFGAGGIAVSLARDRRELRRLFDASRMRLWGSAGLRLLWHSVGRREFWYYLIRREKAEYPLVSWPLLAQQFMQFDRDLKTVTRERTVIEAHWRRKADAGMWRTNIDAGAIGEWSHVPEPALELSTRLADLLGSRWLNVDLIPHDDGFLVSEFSPVWHHYRYQEKPSFIYADDYNIDTPLDVALDLETIIVDSLVARARTRDSNRPPP